MDPPTNTEFVTVLMARKGMSEDDAIKVEAHLEDSLSKLLENVFEKLFPKDLPIADVHFLPQGDKLLRKRQKVNTLSLNVPVLVEYQPNDNAVDHKSGQDIAEKENTKIDAEVSDMDIKEEEVTQHKDKMKILSDNEQAEEVTCDDDEVERQLRDAAKPMNDITETDRKPSVGEPSISNMVKQKNVIVLGKSGSGKSSLGCVLLGKYGEDGFEVDDSKESCTRTVSDMESNTRKIKYYDTVGIDTKAFKENTGASTTNEKIIEYLIEIWKKVGNDGLHAILFTLNFQERCSALDAKLAKFAAANLFSGDISRRVLLIMTNSPEIYYSSDEKAKGYLERECKKAGNHFNKFYDLVDNDNTRVIFVDCRIPKYYPLKKELECIQHNNWIAEKVLNKIHQLGDSPIVVPVAELANRRNEFQKKLEVERKKRKLNQQTTKSTENQSGYERDVRLELAEAMEDLEEPLVEADQNKVTYDNFFTRALTSYSCLHGDTKILLADYSEKNVSDLRVDDHILNRYLQPQKVIGINFSYLQERNMYQFGDDGPLFTADHQFYMVLDKSTTIVVSLKTLLGENPQLDGEDIQEIKNGDTVLKYDTLTQCIKENEIFLKEHKYYPPETKVYFVEVSGDGSYIAQNYIAKHELPDFRKFPFTNICFKKVLEIYKKLDEEKKFPISLEGSLQIKKHVYKIKALWQCVTEFNINMEENKDDSLFDSMVDVEIAMEELQWILNETDAVWFAMYLNQVCTKFLWEQLESDTVSHDVKLKRISSFTRAASLYLNR